MMIDLCDVDSKIPNLVLMKESSYLKSLGEKVKLVTAKELLETKEKPDKIIASAIFTKSKAICEKLKEKFGDKIEIGGTGWDINKVLPEEIERMKPDYDLYSAEMIYKRIKGIMTKETRMKKAETIVNAGIGFTSRGCIRNCAFCFVPKKEGCFKQVAQIKDLLNSRSNVLILNDNNLTADPYCIDKLHEIKERGLVVDINQGCDVRLVNEDIAKALSEVKHLRSVHYAWDLMGFENQVMDGIKILLKYMKAWRHMCFMLVGFNTTFEEDMYRFRRLKEMKITPHVMVYNDKNDIKLKHFERWVNGKYHKACTWEEYEPWVRDQVIYNQISMF
jgi:hypothetical protein